MREASHTATARQWDLTKAANDFGVEIVHQTYLPSTSRRLITLFEYHRRRLWRVKIARAFK